MDKSVGVIVETIILMNFLIQKVLKHLKKLNVERELVIMSVQIVMIIAVLV